MNVSFIRVLFILISVVLGHQIGSVLFGLQSAYGVYGASIGFVFASLIVAIERLTDRVSLRGLSAAVFGLLLALIMAHLITTAMDMIEMAPDWRASMKLILVLIFSYFGIVFGMKGKDEFSVIIPYVKFQRQDAQDRTLLLDTSTIIDGRISDLLPTGFLEGTFVVPQFVLRELQTVADSSDATKRNRGRRGLEILNSLKKNPKFNFKIHNEDYSDLEGVDQKLLRMAKVLDAKVLTTDWNLCKVADVEGIDTLNIHELSKALKPNLLAGDHLSIQISKEGRERQQAVGYLEDGTMVVVEDARQYIGEEKNVEVTSAIQTHAGKMVFAKIV